MSALDGFVLGGAASSLIWFALYAWAARMVCKRIRSLEQGAK